MVLLQIFARRRLYRRAAIDTSAGPSSRPNVHGDRPDYVPQTGWDTPRGDDLLFMCSVLWTGHHSTICSR